MAILSAGGCEPRARSAAFAPIVLDTAGVVPAADYSDLAEVLKQAVRGDGQIRSFALRDQAERLERQLRLLAAAGPTATPDLFPTADDRLAYWCNARAAWAMKLALDCDCPARLTSDAQFHDRPFPLDGRRMTLRDIDAVLARDADWRVLVAAPGLCLDRAALPDRPFTGADVRARAARRFQDFVDDPKRVIVDAERRTVRLPEVLWDARTRLVADYESRYGTQGASLLTAMLPYLEGSSARRIRDAVGYAVAPRPTDGATAITKGP